LLLKTRSQALSQPTGQPLSSVRTESQTEALGRELACHHDLYHGGNIMPDMNH
jgi:hypothetical protein